MQGLTAQLARPPDRQLSDEAFKAFEHCYGAHLFVSGCVYPGVHETLQTLGSAGLTLGCVTNKPEALARDLLAQAGIAPLLDFVHGGDTFETGKPEPEPLTRAAERFGIAPREAVMIGDSVNDFEAAHAAGFDFIFAAYGYAGANARTLKSENTAIDRFADLSQLLCGR